jgi:hypothetical protein
MVLKWCWKYFWIQEIMEGKRVKVGCAPRVARANSQGGGAGGRYLA